MTVVHTEPRLDAHTDAWHTLAEWQRDETRDLLHAHGIDPGTVRAVEVAVVDMPLLTVTMYDTDENGRRYYDPDRDEAATRQVDVALRAPLPAWWRP
jgi:hypothetical protein